MIADFVRRIFGISPSQARPESYDGPAMATAIVPAVPEREDAQTVDRVLANARQAESKSDRIRARATLEQALERWPEQAALHCRLGELHRIDENAEEACDCFELAVHFDPLLTAPHLALGEIFHAAGQHRSAIDCYRRGLQHCPRTAALHSQLAVSLCAVGEFEEALQAAETAVAIEPELGAARHNLGFVRLQRHEPAAALECFEAAVKHGCDVVETQAGSAHALRDLGRFKEAISRYRRILSRKPDFEDVRRNLAATLLLTGDFAGGWPIYEQRFRRSNASRGAALHTRWKGQPLAGRRILIEAEQGLGDQIMFASCIPQVLGQGAECVIDCDPRLERLFRRSFPTALVRPVALDGSAPSLPAPPRVDFRVPTGSLPVLLARGSNGFPSPTAYLVADSSKTDTWRKKLARLGAGLKVGVSWRGGTPLTGQVGRSLRIDLLEGLAGPSVKLVSIQRSAPEEEIRSAVKSGLLAGHWPPALDDLDEAAALLSALDLVVSVDNYNVQLAGALGLKTWALLPFAPHWRYGLAQDRMSWYPAVRLIRQASPGDWEPVIRSVAEELRQQAAAAR